MSANLTGIGARVPRLEDKRFITGRGRYTDDIDRPGQGYAYFLRSPHPHARIRSLDTEAAKTAPGVVAVYTGRDIKKFVPTSDDLMEDDIGGLICGWMIHSKDGSPMKASAHPALAKDTVRYVGDHVAVVVAETLRQAQDAAETDRGRLRVARIRSSIRAPDAGGRQAGGPCRASPATRSTSGSSATRPRPSRLSRAPRT